MPNNRLLSRQPIIYLLTCLFSGFSSAFMGPLLSLYLIDELKVSPISMGFLISMMILSGVLVSQYFAKKSDAGTSRKAIILLGQLGFFCSTVILALTRNYYIALAAVIFFMSFSACSLPQIFTMGRNYADKYLATKAVLFITMMRASIAVAWVIGPPLAFLVNDQFGFTQTFLIAASSAISVFFIVLIGLPNLHIEIEHSAEKPVHWQKIPGVLLFLLCMFFTFSANSMYITSISLYLTQELDLPSKWAGYLMGIAAFIEIPIMLSAGYLSLKIGTHRLIFIACSCGLIFHGGLLIATQPWQLLLLQVFNALFIGITACLGMVVAQDMMKKQMGLASTLFNSSQMLSMLLSSLMVGLIAQYFSYYAIFIVSTLFCALAVLFLYLAERQIQAVKNNNVYA
ncbi:sugar efflux transporter SetB [Psychromonas marina]|uniref:Sugar efflux transporter SetB n=1 Tax=Psychromonas marina TaxID=88364 RepID=A0ABQ6E556_9GAMM|nr:sugar efflux transporter [Psychromonas marina]GLS92553.1 sugar efflux transporter SetB [Psychromonas marina]